MQRTTKDFGRKYVDGYARRRMDGRIVCIKLDTFCMKIFIFVFSRPNNKAVTIQTRVSIKYSYSL